jgi:hypothetical protein
MYEPASQGQYGYGWGLRQKTLQHSRDTLHIAEHSGSVNGFGSYIGQVLEDTTLVLVLKNSRDDTYISPAYAPAIGEEIISILYDEDVRPHKKSIARYIALCLGRYGFERAKDEYYHIKKNDPEHYSFDESELNKLGIELLFKFNRVDDAVRIFYINMVEFPKSYNTYDSYAYALMHKEDYASSIQFYQKGLEILQKYPEYNSGEQVHKDAEKALEYIREMEGRLK